MSDDVSVIRFADTQGRTSCFRDAALPAHARSVRMLIGPNGGWDDPADRPAMDASDFCVGMVEAEPGKGPSLHRHATVEVFVPLTGRWTVYWGPTGDESVEVGPWDVVSVAPGVFRGFRNSGSETALLLGISGGIDAGGNAYAPVVLAQLAAAGLDGRPPEDDQAP